MSPLPARASIDKPGPTPVKASFDDDTRVVLVVWTASPVPSFDDVVVACDPVDGAYPPRGLLPPFLAVAGDVVVVVVVGAGGDVVVVAGGGCPQLIRLTLFPEYHFPSRRTSAWNLQGPSGGTTTVSFPEVPEAVPSSFPLAQRFNVHRMPGVLLGPTTKVAWVALTVGGRPLAKANVPIPSTPKRTANEPDSNRLIFLLLAQRSIRCVSF